MGNESSIVVEDARSHDPYYDAEVPKHDMSKKEMWKGEMLEKDEEPTIEMYEEDENEGSIAKEFRSHQAKYEMETGIPVDEQALMDIGPGSVLLTDDHPHVNILAIDTPAVEYEFHTGISIEEQVENDVGPASHLFEDEIIEEEVVTSPRGWVPSH